MNESKPPRRIRYQGSHPKTFQEKYKELQPDLYADDVEKVIQKGGTPAGMHRSICVNEILEFLKITGKGNKDREVSGLGMVADATFYDENTPLNVLLSGIYDDESEEGLEGLGVVTSAAVAAASSAMAIIAGLIKQIGGIKKGGKDAPSGEEGSSSENVDTSDAGGDSG